MIVTYLNNCILGCIKSEFVSHYYSCVLSCFVSSNLYIMSVNEEVSRLVNCYWDSISFSNLVMLYGIFYYDPNIQNFTYCHYLLSTHTPYNYDVIIHLCLIMMTWWYIFTLSLHSTCKKQNTDQLYC